MIKFGLLVQSGGKWDGEQLIPSRFIEKATSRIHTNPQGTSYGYFWWRHDVDVDGKTYDVKSGRGAGGQFIMMIDEFDAENGATRFVPGSHLQSDDPDTLPNRHDAHAEQVLACGPAGSLVIFNGSVWHSHTANRSARRRRSLQGHFVPRDAQASVDHAARMRPEVLQRIGARAKYVLAISTE